MRFKLVDHESKPVHEAVLPMNKRPEIVTWGTRAFLHEYDSGPNRDIPVYRETTVYQIGKFR